MKKLLTDEERRALGLPVGDKITDAQLAVLRKHGYKGGRTKGDLFAYLLKMDEEEHPEGTTGDWYPPQGWSPSWLKAWSRCGGNYSHIHAMYDEILVYLRERKK